MSLCKFYFIFSLGFFLVPYAGAATVIEYERGLQEALSVGDYFRAYRLGLSFENDFPEEFLSKGIEGYLKSLFKLGSSSDIKRDCENYVSKSSKATYLCGLNFLENKNTDLSLHYFSKITKKTNLYWPTQILISSAFLIKNLPEEALKKINVEDLEQYKKINLSQLYYITISRIYLALGRYEESIKYSQSIDSYSSYYAEALEQTAWSLFKIKKFESAQVLLDVLISSYEGSKKSSSDLSVSPALYFKSRYLKAYLALQEQRQEGASGEFSQLKADFDNFIKKNRPLLAASELSKNFGDSSTVKSSNQIPENIESHLTSMSEWLGADISIHYRDSIQFQSALNMEIQRVKILGTGDAKKYLTILEKLKNKSFTKLEGDYSESLKKLNRSLDVLSLKAELGQLDVFWLNRASGAKNLEEAIESYNQSSRSLEGYIDL